MFTDNVFPSKTLHFSQLCFDTGNTLLQVRKKNSFSDLNLNLKLHLNLIQSVNPSLKSFVVVYNHHFDDCVEVSEVNDLISHGCYFLLDFSL